MDSTALRAVQQPLKDAYRDDPQAAVVTLEAHGELGDENISCSVATGQALAVAGLRTRQRRGRVTGLFRGHAACRRWSPARASRCGRWPRRCRSPSPAEPCTPRATWISAGRWP